MIVLRHLMFIGSDTVRSFSDKNLSYQLHKLSMIALTHSKQKRGSITLKHLTSQAEIES